ncbi:hypothetical protein K3495_g8091 [Podosphaera aphanis]|nr:hypothetical protein K3495_g8091 [Podosphaera aphanis]
MISSIRVLSTLAIRIVGRHWFTSSYCVDPLSLKQDLTLLASIEVGTLRLKGLKIPLFVATTTDSWKRTDLFAKRIGLTAKSILEKFPERLAHISIKNAARLTVIETPHQSPSDNKYYYSVIIYYINNKTKIQHIEASLDEQHILETINKMNILR